MSDNDFGSSTNIDSNVKDKSEPETKNEVQDQTTICPQKDTQDPILSTEKGDDNHKEIDMVDKNESEIQEEKENEDNEEEVDLPDSFFDDLGDAFLESFDVVDSCHSSNEGYLTDDSSATIKLPENDEKNVSKKNTEKSNSSKQRLNISHSLDSKSSNDNKQNQNKEPPKGTIKTNKNDRKNRALYESDLSRDRKYSKREKRTSSFDTKQNYNVDEKQNSRITSSRTLGRSALPFRSKSTRSNSRTRRSRSKNIISRSRRRRSRTRSKDRSSRRRNRSPAERRARSRNKDPKKSENKNDNKSNSEKNISEEKITPANAVNQDIGAIDISMETVNSKGNDEPITPVLLPPGTEDDIVPPGEEPLLIVNSRRSPSHTRSRSRGHYRYRRRNRSRSRSYLSLSSLSRSRSPDSDRYKRRSRKISPERKRKRSPFWKEIARKLAKEQTATNLFVPPQPNTGAAPLYLQDHSSAHPPQGMGGMVYPPSDSYQAPNTMEYQGPPPVPSAAPPYPPPYYMSGIPPSSGSLAPNIQVPMIPMGQIPRPVPPPMYSCPPPSLPSTLISPKPQNTDPSQLFKHSPESSSLTSILEASMKGQKSYDITITFKLGSRVEQNISKEHVCTSGDFIPSQSGGQVTSSRVGGIKKDQQLTVDPELITRCENAIKILQADGVIYIIPLGQFIHRPHSGESQGSPNNDVVNRSPLLQESDVFFKVSIPPQRQNPSQLRIATKRLNSTVKTITPTPHPQIEEDAVPKPSVAVEKVDMAVGPDESCLYDSLESAPQKQTETIKMVQNSTQTKKCFGRTVEIQVSVENDNLIGSFKVVTSRRNRIQNKNQSQSEFNDGGDCNAERATESTTNNQIVCSSSPYKQISSTPSQVSTPTIVASKLPKGILKNRSTANQPSQMSSSHAIINLGHLPLVGTSLPTNSFSQMTREQFQQFLEKRK
uniref:Uncharacterized protein n=1 Tax=Timema cristinae TaxID=61476 RepID=A0A7R9GTC3_TIMCR|nr:unnamed protein product [Timema cristinae]